MMIRLIAAACGSNQRVLVRRANRTPCLPPLPVAAQFSEDPIGIWDTQPVPPLN
jgi:hypothetical protein